MADREVGWLATTVTLYDALDKDIRRAFPSIHQAVEKVLIRFPALAGAGVWHRQRGGSGLSELRVGTFRRRQDVGI